MDNQKPTLICISYEGNVTTGETREVSRLYGNAAGLIRDERTLERSAGRLRVLRGNERTLERSAGRLRGDDEQPFELTAEQFAAIAAYHAACQQPTPNAEGVHVGDIFYDIWGYDQTNVDFYQVVSLRAAHTAVIRRIGGRVVEESGMSGKIVPDRDNFLDDETFTVRTQPNKWDASLGPWVRDPRFRDQRMSRTDDFKPHDFSTWA